MGEAGECSAVYNHPNPKLEFDHAEGSKGKSGKGECSVRPFLKKGSGLVRYYRGQPPKQFKRKSRPSDDIDQGCGIEGDEDEIHVRGKGSPSHGKDVEEDELRMFEELEKATVAASFCSTSSLAARFLQSKCKMRKGTEEQEFLPEMDEGPSDLCSLPSSLFGSGDEDEDDDDEEEEEDGEESIYIAERSLREIGSRESNFLEKSPVNHRMSQSSMSKDFDMLQQENNSLKTRIVYLEEKMEKNTLEWWSHKEQMVQIVHSLQSTISRRDKQLENIQDSLTKKMETLEEDLRAKSHKWSQSQIGMIEKIRLLEEELQIKKEQQTLLRNKMQKSVDSLTKELRDKTSECVLSRELSENRISALETMLSQGNAMLPRKVPPKVTLAEHTKEPIETVDDNIFGTDEQEAEQGVVKILPNGDKETIYPNGTRKVIAHNLSEMKHYYTNGDIRILKRDGTVKYLYAESATWQTSYTNGVEYYEFANGQVERRNPNGVVEIVFTNGCVKYAHPSGTEECIFADNTILRVDPGGERSVVLPNGQQEIYGSDYKKRIYPDGTVKTVYSDGTQETRYPNGRVRIKDKQGTLLADISDNNKHSGENAS
ncbi:unnamed protein product [Allacma fusca]|uniref:Centromere protein J C-terminal domain-containing protein n=1 Tax=Allacma fusca TaxID=39272 RepID=A0A8J2KP80_9HEXA|nr:unnamed protein product [Allacma fusca]